MTVCFQLDPKDCPDIRHAGQRIIKMNSVPENPQWRSWTVESGNENLKGLIQQLQKVAKHRQVLPQSSDFGALLELQEAARRLSRQTEDEVEWLAAAMALIQQRMTYDPQLAEDYSRGRDSGLSLKEAWSRGRGTCREFAMEMAALCREQGIPVRYVQGISAPNQLHVWNEVYFDPTGWLAVDALSGLIGYWGNRVTLRIAETISELPMPSVLKLKITEPLAIKQDRQVYLHFKKMPKALEGAGQFLLKAWRNEFGVRCLVHLQAYSSTSNTALSPAVFEKISSFTQTELLTQLETSSEAAMQVWEQLCESLRQSGFAVRIASGVNWITGQPAVWLELETTPCEWLKLDISTQTLGYPSDCVRLSVGNSAAEVIAGLRESAGN